MWVSVGYMYDTEATPGLKNSTFSSYPEREPIHALGSRIVA